MKLFLFFAYFAATAAAASIEFFVATDGNDLSDGTISSPFKTLFRAQHAVRSSTKAHGVIVNIREGFYSTYSKDTLLALNVLDSGLSPYQMVTWRAYKNEKVLLSGGIPIPFNSFVQSVKAGYILQADLFSLGISNIGSIRTSNGLGDCVNDARLELYFNGKPAVLARYPNIVSSTDSNSRPYLSVGTTYSDSLSFDTGATLSSRLQNWKQEKDPYLHGYWTYTWADNYVKIGGIQGTTITIDPSTPPIYGSISSDARYYGVNLLCELDSPGEYYVDKDLGILYLSIKETCIVISLGCTSIT